MARIDHIHPCDDCGREINTLAAVCIACRQARVRDARCIYCGEPMDPENPDDVIPSGRRAGELRKSHIVCSRAITQAFNADRIPGDDIAPAYRHPGAKESIRETKRGID